MYGGTPYQLMADYKRWQNAGRYGVCAQISDADRKRDLGAFFESIHGTLNHLLHGVLAWFGRFVGPPISNALGKELYADFGALRAAREQLHGKIIERASGVADDWLRRSFEFVSGVDSKRRVLPAWILVTQGFNHRTHHRGQVTTLLKHLGLDPGVTDIPRLPELAAGGNPA